MRRTWKRIAVALAIGLGVALAGSWWFRDALLDAALARFASQTFSDPESLGDGDLHVVLCGTAGPVGGAKQRSACNAVIADGEMRFVDAGAGSTV